MPIEDWEWPARQHHPERSYLHARKLRGWLPDLPEQGLGSASRGHHDAACMGDPVSIWCSDLQADALRGGLDRRDIAENEPLLMPRCKGGEQARRLDDGLRDLQDAATVMPKDRRPIRILDRAGSRAKREPSAQQSRHGRAVAGGPDGAVVSTSRHRCEIGARRAIQHGLPPFGHAGNGSGGCPRHATQGVLQPAVDDALAPGCLPGAKRIALNQARRAALHDELLQCEQSADAAADHHRIELGLSVGHAGMVGGQVGGVKPADAATGVVGFPAHTVFTSARGAHPVDRFHADTTMHAHKAVLIPGDGIGPEVAAATRLVMERAGAGIEWVERHAGLGAVERGANETLPASTVEAVQAHRIALKGPCTTPIGEGFTSVNVALRKRLNLFGAVRPVRSLDGVQTRFSESGVDIVIIRENTEGLYAGIENEITPGVVTSLKVVTEEASRRIARFAFDYAVSRGRRKVTVLHKANIMKLGDGLFVQGCR